MSKQGETKFKERVIRDLKAYYKDNIKITKTQQRAQRGLPDLLICLLGDYIEMELKIDGEKPEPLQEVNLERTIKAGGFAFWTCPIQWDTHFATIKDRYVLKPE